MSTFTTDWTSRHFPLWREVLKDFVGKPCRALELGTFEGRSALFFLTEILTHDQSSLICVDSWRDKNIYRRFIENVLTADVHDRCEWRRGDTHKILRTIRHPFDFIYIDADHRSHAVLSDGALAFNLLPVGGVLIFDDYLWSPPDGNVAPKIGIDAFLSAFVGRYELLHQDWQVIVRRTV